MPATKKAAPVLPTGAELAVLELDVVRRVTERGAVPRSDLDVPKGVLAVLAARLAAAGLELKPKVVRLSPEVQLSRRLSRGSFPLKGLEKQIAGATRAEARAALEKLVRAKQAVVLRGDGEGDVSPPTSDLLTAADRARVAAVAKALAALAKAPGKSALAPRTRWADVTELVEDVLGHGIANPTPTPTLAATPTATATRRSELATRSLEADLLAGLRTTRDDSGIASVAAAARTVSPRPTAAALAVALRALAAQGAIELRIASQPHLLAPDEREVCPTDAAGRVLAYARLVEV